MKMDLKQLASMFKRTAKEAPPQVQTQVGQIAKMGVGIMKREIQNVHAVDTGAMLNSTTAEKLGPTTYLIGPTVPYAVYVALGTSKMPARPYHTVAARELTRSKNLIKLDFSKPK